MRILNIVIIFVSLIRKLFLAIFCIYYEIDFSPVDNLSYVRLRHLVSRKPHLLQQATNQVLGIIKEISHSQDYGDREALLPMLHLFRELITMVTGVGHVVLSQLRLVSSLEKKHAFVAAISEI